MEGTEEGVAMVVKVTSGRAGLDRIDKRYAYARGGIPLSLPVDRDQESVGLFSESLRDDYPEVASVPFGEVFALPDPFGSELDTADVLCRRLPHSPAAANSSLASSGNGLPTT